MPLGAAACLAGTRKVTRRVALISPPAEDGGGGAGVMVRDGVMERFGIAQVHALHNRPGEAEGRFLGRPGPIMAAVDTLTVRVAGQGGRGAHPEDMAGPVAAMVQMVGRSGPSSAATARGAMRL